MTNKPQPPNQTSQPSPLNEGVRGHVGPPGNPPQFTPPKKKPLQSK